MTCPDCDSLRKEIARLRDWLEGYCYCPCCEGIRECLPGCTCTHDAPSDAENQNAVRELLFGKSK
jgi:hypothetical protein